MKLLKFDEEKIKGRRRYMDQEARILKLKLKTEIPSPHCHRGVVYSTNRPNKMGLTAQDIVNQLLLSFDQTTDNLIRLKLACDICLQAVKILESQMIEESDFVESDKTKVLKEQSPIEKDLSSVLSSDVLCCICEYLNYHEVVGFQLLNKSLFVSLIGYTLKLDDSMNQREPLMKRLNELSKLRINKLTTSSTCTSCNCIALRLVNVMAQEFPRQLAICPIEYSKVSSKYQCSPTISELKSIGYYQPWTISHICLSEQLSDEDMNRIVEMKHILRLKSLSIIRQRPLPNNMLENLEQLEIVLQTDNDFSFVSNLSNLKCLAIRDSFCSFNIEILISLHRLEKLTIDDCCSLEINLEVLSSLHYLKCLEIIYIQNVCGDMSSLSSLDQLSEITICGPWDSGKLSSFSNLTTLKKLNLTDCENIVGDLSSLSKLVHLNILSLGHKKIIGDIQYLSSMITLTKLNLECTKVSGDLSSLSSLKNLRFCRCTFTNIEGNIDSLSSLIQLEQLDLSDTNITGNLNAFNNMLNLTELWLTNTSVFGHIEFESCPRI